MQLRRAQYFVDASVDGLGLRQSIAGECRARVVLASPEAAQTSNAVGVVVLRARGGRLRDLIPLGSAKRGVVDEIDGAGRRR